MDPLTDVLRTLHLSGSFPVFWNLSRPWGIRLDPHGATLFHIVIAGRGMFALEPNAEEPAGLVSDLSPNLGSNMPSAALPPDPLIPGGTHRTIALEPGDMIMIPHGQSHRLMDAAETPIVPESDIERDPDAHPAGPVQYGGTGPVTELVCGHFRFDRAEVHPLLSLMPPFLHLRGTETLPLDWLQATLAFLAREARNMQPGSGALLDRMLGALFIQAARHFVQSLSRDGGNWLAALGDSNISRALDAIHRDPAHPWNISELASRAGMSRTVFTARFKELVGQTPKQYLSRWRIHQAAYYLRTEKLTISRLLERVGFQSEASFSRLFKRYLGESPAAYRRRAQQQPSP